MEAYKAEAHLARLRAEDARSDDQRESQLARAESSESAANVAIRKYRTGPADVLDGLPRLLLLPRCVEHH